MAPDLKIEIFAYCCFYKSWSNLGVKDNKLNILQIYGDECIKENSYSEACDIKLANAVGGRMILFSKLYIKELDFEKAINWKHLSDFYDYVTLICDKDELFGHLTIFERMFATCAFVLELCTRIYQHSLIDVVNYGHIIWAMYFDKFTETFYREGGWSELKRVAERYHNISGFLFFHRYETITASCLYEFQEASVNYIQFKKVLKHDNFKYKHKSTIHISKPWVQFHIECFNEYVRIPPSYDNSVDTINIELLLTHLKIIFSFLIHGCDVFEIWQKEFPPALSSTGIPYSTTVDNCLESKIIDDLRIQNPAVSETFCKKFLKSSNLEMKIQGGINLASSENNVFNESINNTEHLEYAKKCPFKMEVPKNKSSVNLDGYSHKGYNIIHNKSMNPQLEPSIKISTNSGDLDLNQKFAVFNSEDEDLGETSSRNVNRLSDVMNPTNNLSTNQNEELESPRKTLSKILCNPIDLRSEIQVIESSDARERSKSPLDSIFSHKNEDEYNGNIEITYASSTTRTAATICERNAIPSNLYTPEDSFTVNEVTSKNDGKIIMNKELVKLREEKNDPAIKLFLRMILILGDRQGNHYVRGILSCNEASHENSQVKSSKRKKRSKKSRK